MSGGHLVRPADAVELVAPTTGWAGGATGYRRCMAVGEDDHAVHTGFMISELDPGGSIPWHVHSFEESCYVITGTAVIDTAEGSFRVAEGGYGVVPIAMPHRWRNESQLPVRWVEMQAPGPRSAYQDDTFLSGPSPSKARFDEAQRAISMCAIRATVTSARSRRHRWTPRSRARTCSKSRQACALRCWCMEGSM